MILFKRLKEERLLKRAQGLARRGRMEDAVVLLDQGLQLRPDSFGLSIHKALILNNLHKFDEALACLRSISAGADQTCLQKSFVGLVLYDSARLDEAESELKKAIALKPDYRLPKAFLTLVLLSQQRYSEARKWIEDVGIPDSIHFKPRLFLLMEKQMLHFPRLADADAITRTETEAAGAGAERLGRLKSAGVQAYDRGDWLEALRSFLIGHREKPKDLDCLIGLAEVYSMLSLAVPELRERAQTFHDRVRAQDEQDEWGRFYHAKHWVRSGRADEALPEFEALYKRNSNFVECLIEMGIAHLALGDEHAARRCFNRNLSLDCDSFPSQLTYYLKTYCDLEYGS